MRNTADRSHGGQREKNRAFARANLLRFNNEFDKAAALYENIIAEFPAECEAYWGLVLCKFGIEYVDDPTTGNKKPTCHRTMLESVYNDADFQKALDYSDSVANSLYRKEAKEIDAIQQAILNIAKNETPYDIFICYKETDSDGQRTKDSVIAQDIYEALTQKGYKVFFARITLEDKLGQEYEPYIFSAISTAQVMLSIGTSYENFNAVWVKNEWSRFIAMMKTDKSKTLIPCYCDCDAYDMPQEFKNLQGQDMSKVGFVQDLVRGISKILNPKIEGKLAQQNIPSSNIQNLVKRGVKCLEAEEWKKADEFFERVLDEDIDCADALIGKLLVKDEINPSLSYYELYWELWELGDKVSSYKKELFDQSSNPALTKILVVVNAILNAPTLEGVETFVVPDGTTEIRPFAFLKASSLKSIILPDSVTTIGDMAFYDCKSLTSITLPDGVTTIGEGAFSGCESLTSITLPDGVTTIGKEAFGGCESLTSITLPDGLTTIGKEAFIGCESLTSITLPGGLTTIGESAFSECESLTSITLPDGLTTIGDGAFSCCESLTSITLPDGVTTIDDWAFGGCKLLTSITLPGGLTTIGESAFSECESLTSITLPDNVNTIGNSAFSGCKSLTSITLPDSVTTIGDRAFSGCESLTSITLTGGVTTIGDRAFSGCESLTSITLTGGVTTIGDWAFYDCKSLTSITLPDGVTSIGKSAFYACESLTSITLPDSVTTIGDWAFFPAILLVLS